MKMIEISYMSNMKELEKLNAKLERAKKALEKKQANAEKYGVADWTNADRLKWLETVETNNGWIVNDKDCKKNGAWFDLSMAKGTLEEVTGQIARAEKRLEKAEEKVAAYHKEIEEIASLKEKEELYKLEFEQERKEWAKDGIVLEDRYSGITPSGKRFSIYGNSGMTMRSRHCFTLAIEGKGVVFTSGEFWRAYGIVKKS